MTNRSPAKSKFSYAQLALADWLAEDSAKRFAVVSTDHHSSKSIALYQMGKDGVEVIASPSAGCKDTALLDRLGGDLEINYLPVVEARAILAQHSNFVRDDGNPNGFESFMLAIGFTDYAKAQGGLRLLRYIETSNPWWKAEGIAAFEVLKSKREAQRTAVGRTIVIGAKCLVYAHIDEEKKKSFPAGFRHPIPDLTLVRPTWTARVVKETKERLYIQDVERIRNDRSNSRERDSIRGSAPNQFVERQNVLIDGALDDAAGRLVAIDEERIERYYSACDTALAAALEPLLTLHARLFQAEAMHDDLMGEAIAAGTAKKV
jgi:hypothetical protein